MNTTLVILLAKQLIILYQNKKMKKILFLTSMVLLITVSFIISSAQKSSEKNKMQFSNSTNEWKLGVALYTFHTFSFPEALSKADSAGVKYIEGFTFGKSGPELKDSMVMQLSPAGIDKLKQMINEKGLKMESIYVVGGNTIDAWKKEFNIARQLDVKYVTGEPPIIIQILVPVLISGIGQRVE